MKFAFLFISVLVIDALNEEYEKYFSDNVQFALSYYGGHDLSEHNDNKLQISDIYTPDNEAYKCLLPEIELNAS
jgi:hypothetical protein